MNMLHTTQNSSDNLPSYPPDSHHSSDIVFWREGVIFTQKCCYAWLYLVEGEKPVRAGNEPGELGQTRRKLIDFLQTSDFYEPERLLTHFTDNCK